MLLIDTDTPYTGLLLAAQQTTAFWLGILGIKGICGMSVESFFFSTKAF